MPSKKKKGSRPAGPTHNESLRADIASQRPPDGALDDDGFDIADELLASLDARDAAAAELAQSQAEPSGAGAHSQAVPVPAMSATHNGTEDSSAKSGSASISPSKRLSQDIKAASGRIIDGIKSHMHVGSPPSKDDSATEKESSSSGAHIGGFFHARRGSRPSSSNGSTVAPAPSGALPGAQVAGLGATSKKRNRAKERLQRRDAAAEAARVEAALELQANGGKPDEAARERQGIDDLCRALGRVLHEVEPDGHCLYAAVADQLNVLRGIGSSTAGTRFAPAHDEEAGGAGEKISTPQREELGMAPGALTYKDTRRAAAKEMRAHPDDFKPFISDSDEKMAGIVDDKAGQTSGDASKQDRAYLAYCDAVENTGVWGGQPEILALSRAFQTQINVVQVGYPTLKVGEGEYGRGGDDSAAFISYHRRMYGLGEHYNSLRKR